MVERAYPAIDSNSLLERSLGDIDFSHLKLKELYRFLLTLKGLHSSQLSSQVHSTH